jgi:hypothetical protein
MPVLASKLEDRHLRDAVNVFRTDIFCCADQLGFNEVVEFFADAFDFHAFDPQTLVGSQRKFAVDQLTCRIPHHQIEADFPC